MSGKSVFDNNDETSSGKLARKAKESPFMLIGLAGLIGACGVGAYKFKHRGQMSPSVFLMQLRVIAQGTVVGCLTVGLAVTMAKEYLFSKPKEQV
uniref:Putative conserved plasma membrane protein n=1 Tax=Tabanus bromius TaxID=304241 RepID=A0A0K8TRA6_TABBR